jgi:HlyD family secretion protein
MSTTRVTQQDELARIVAEGQRSNRRRWTRWLAVTGVTFTAVIAGVVMTRSGARSAAPVHLTQAATRGELVVTVSATGNLQPTNEVAVGSEVSGLVEAVFVDENDRVKKGQVLARLDVSKLQDQVVNARAALASAEARVLQAAASVKETNANLARLRQVSDLSGGKVPSKAEMETAEATAARARADEASAVAAVEQSRASLNSAETSLAKASIRSPIDGVVLTREIEPGQTVAASFQAPTLFTLAEDLSEMELQVDVDEADVGSVREGQAATFTVDAYSGRKYPARITRVGYGSQTKDNVVSYKTLLTVDNDDLTLRPGMTATAEITIVRRSDALLVPNAALRYTPPVTAEPAGSGGGIVSSLLPRPPGMPAKTRPANGNKDAQQVWVLRDGQPEAVPVTVGATDGRVTEVTAGDLKPGMLVITESSGGQA